MLRRPRCSTEQNCRHRQSQKYAWPASIPQQTMCQWCMPRKRNQRQPSSGNVRHPNATAADPPGSKKAHTKRQCPSKPHADNVAAVARAESKPAPRPTLALNWEELGKMRLTHMRDVVAEHVNTYGKEGRPGKYATRKTGDNYAEAGNANV